ncbi:MAG: hypothetical protein HND27_09600 [Bacteroidetes bacterium]|mgnify:CR=1 FL=1|nr:hypothetical protein [Flavobacteriales bacterium]MCL4817392.1 hypothetical protein [Flavobacteriales bacterium]NOG96019.1 hypothetical protein [Bacteroidota bacterium]WKZ75184.1 MAG: hypothetical protein QY303_13660 [Vicingaceae bacterium]CAG0996360.1 hypothetical protein FLAV_02620 [Flavobacteriales bacterium]
MENQIDPVLEFSQIGQTYSASEVNNSIFMEPSETYFTPSPTNTIFTEKSLEEYNFQVSSFEKKKTTFCLDEKF